MYTEIMFQDFYIFRIHKNVFKVVVLGLTTLVTFEPSIRLPMNTRRSKTSLHVTDV